MGFDTIEINLVVKTPTQPQHNLTQPEVGLDTIIGLHNFAPAAARPHQELYFYLKEWS